MRKSVRWLVRLLPAWLPGKTRIARGLLRSLPNHDVDIRTSSGLTLRAPSPREPIAFHLLSNGIYEPATVAAILRMLPPATTFIDVGANIGAIALEIARRRPDVTVIAIEASPDILWYLEHNIATNNLTNVRISKVAASDHEGDIDFYLPPATQFGMASVAPQFGVVPCSVPARTLDGILAAMDVPVVSVIKIDAEGAELDVIRGAKALLKGPNAPAIVFEFVDWAEARLHEPGDAQRELMRLGYKLSELDGGTGIVSPIESGGVMLLAQYIPGG